PLCQKRSAPGSLTLSFSPSRSLASWRRVFGHAVAKLGLADPFAVHDHIEIVSGDPNRRQEYRRLRLTRFGLERLRSGHGLAFGHLNRRFCRGLAQIVGVLPDADSLLSLGDAIQRRLV